VSSGLEGYYSHMGLLYIIHIGEGWTGPKPINSAISPLLKCWHGP
jgi:hypothetical protein